MDTPDQITWPTLLADLIDGHDLGREASEWAMAQIMAGEATPAQVAGFLIGLRAKGERVEEMHGLAEQMLAHANRIEVQEPSLDIVVPILGALLVVAAGKLLASRQSRVPEGRIEPHSQHAEVRA